jgi:hypothetical protein
VAHVVEHLLKRYKTLSSTPVSKKKKMREKKKKNYPVTKMSFPWRNHSRPSSFLLRRNLIYFTQKKKPM